MINVSPLYESKELKYLGGREKHIKVPSQLHKSHWDLLCYFSSKLILPTSSIFKTNHVTSLIFTLLRIVNPLCSDRAVAVYIVQTCMYIYATGKQKVKTRGCTTMTMIIEAYKYGEAHGRQPPPSLLLLITVTTHNPLKTKKSDFTYLKKKAKEY